jgi:VIT1/CCC1 family predicted Fe2+/Mn2+ transporter
MVGGRNVTASYFRNFVFGVEDSLVSTVGLLSGIAIAGMSSRSIFVTGFVLIFVEAFSMAVGSFLSERSAQDYVRQAEAPIRRPLRDGGIMFFSYFVSGFIPLFPYVVLPVASAFWVSIVASLAALFTLGAFGAKLSNLNLARNGAVMLVVGGAAILVGVLVGKIANGP